MSVVASWRPTLGRGKAWPPEGELCGSQCNQCGDPEGREEGGWEGSRVTSVQTWCPDSQKTRGRTWPLTGGRIGCEWGCKSKGSQCLRDWAQGEGRRWGAGGVGNCPANILPPGNFLQGDWCPFFPSSPMSCSSSLPSLPPPPSLPSSLPFFFIAKSDYANHGFSVAFLP